MSSSTSSTSTPTTTCSTLSTSTSTSSSSTLTYLISFDCTLHIQVQCIYSYEITICLVLNPPPCCSFAHHFSGGNGHPLLICSSQSTVQLCPMHFKYTHIHVYIHAHCEFVLSSSTIFYPYQLLQDPFTCVFFSVLRSNSSH